MKKFVLLTTQRSGSTWVIDYLNSHPQIVAYSEMFLENAQGKPKYGGAKDKNFWSSYLAKTREHNKLIKEKEILNQYLDSLFACEQAKQAIGFKLMYGQAGALPYLTDYLKSNNVVIVHLIRKNLLDIIISKETAFLRNLYHTRNESDIKQIALRLRTSDLIQRLRWQQREVEIAREKYRQIGLPYLEMYYEDLIASQANFDNLFITLDVNETDYELTSSLKKINTSSQREMISNYDDVARLLNLSGFGELLRE